MCGYVNEHICACSSGFFGSIFKLLISSFFQKLQDHILLKQTSRPSHLTEDLIPRIDQGSIYKGETLTFSFE